MATCRACKEVLSPMDNYVRKSLRHNYHWNCFLMDRPDHEKRLLLLNLPKHQLEKIPWRIAEQHGVTGLVKDLLAGLYAPVPARGTR